VRKGYGRYVLWLLKLSVATITFGCVLIALLNAIYVISEIGSVDFNKAESIIIILVPLLVAVCGSLVLLFVPFGKPRR
jgi:hypothetical protein